MVIPIVAAVVFDRLISDIFARITSKLALAPRAAHSSFDDVRRLTGETIVWRGIHFSAQSLWPILAFALFVPAMLALLHRHRHRPDQDLVGIPAPPEDRPAH